MTFARASEGYRPNLRGASTRSERPQNQKINHPRHREMDTSRLDGVKASLHDGTPRSYRRDIFLEVHLEEPGDDVLVAPLVEVSTSFLPLQGVGHAL